MELPGLGRGCRAGSRARESRGGLGPDQIRSRLPTMLELSRSGSLWPLPRLSPARGGSFLESWGPDLLSWA